MYANDQSFGPFLRLPDKATSDFTLLFEEVILSIVPSTLLLLATPPRCVYLWRASYKVASSWLQTIKIILLVVFTFLQIANVVLVCRSWLQTPASVAAAVLALVSSLGLCILSYLEHHKSIQPSSIISAYLVLTLPFDAARLRTRLLRDDIPGTGIASALLTVKLLVLITEAVDKKSILLAPYATRSPEATSGLFSRIFFWWLNPLFRLGFKNAVNKKDLFASDEELLSSSLQARFGKHWANRKKFPSSHTLVWVMWRTMLKPFIAAMVPRLALVFFKFMQPLLIHSVIQLVNEPEAVSADDRGYGLVAATALVYIGLALADGFYQHKANRMAAMVRGSLINAIYTQTLDLSTKDLDESAAVTLMSSDVERICEALLPVHNVWSNPLECGIAIWLLYEQIGLALIGPLIVATCAAISPFLISGAMKNAQKNWLEAIQSRIDTTAKMLPVMKGVKMLGLSTRMSSIIHELRLTEVHKSLRMRKLIVAMTALGNSSYIFVPGAAFAAFVVIATINGQTLDVSSAFTALSLIMLLVTPVSALIFTVPTLVAAVGCSDRIQTYLESPVRRDYRALNQPQHGRAHHNDSQETLVNSMVAENNIESEKKEKSPTVKELSASVRATGLTLAWAEDKKPVINNVSFCASSGSLTMVVGPIGCGKSTLLRGLLGEIAPSHGTVFVDQAHSAVVDQTTWIQNTTIRSNIVGMCDFEPEWYASVIHACALDTDISTLSGGDFTNVGSSGAAISGGQKLRVALARAVYSRQPVLMLDDVFSGLDATSEDRIFSRLLGTNGLLRRLGTTVVVVTHAAHRLSYADQIVALDNQGTIAEQGTFTELIESQGYVAELAVQHKTEGESVAQEDPPTGAAVTDSEIDRLNATAELYRPVADWSLYKYYASAVGRKNVFIWIGLMVCYAALMRFPDLWLKFWTQAVTSHGNSVNGLYLGILIAVEVAAMIMLIAEAAVFLVVMVPRSARYLHTKLLDTVVSAPLAFLTSTDTGQLVNHFSQDLSVIDMELPLGALVLACSVSTVIFQAILICISASYFAAVLPGLLVVMWLVQKFYLRTSRQIRLMDLEAKAPLYSNFLETLSGLVTIRAFGWAEKMEKRNMELLDASQKPFYLLYCIQRWLALVLDLLVAALAIILVGLITGMRSSADAGFVGVAMVNIMSFNIQLSDVVKGWTAVETSLGAISRVKTFVHSTGSENLPQETKEVPPNWPSNGEINLSNVCAAYKEEQPPALHDISLSVSAGQKLGVCGASGAGKSSFVTLLFHMLEIQAGSMTIDGVDLSSIPRQTLRERLTIITQEPIFLRGTVRENLFCMGLVNESFNIESVLRKVGLWDIVSEAGGLDVPMEPEELLSHGQRQLFCLARAMLRPTKILVIDEATAHVDLQTDRLMQRIIRDHFRNCTIIAVAHRLQTIRDFDKIAVFESGKIVEHGDPDALLANEGSKFRALWDA